MKLALIGLLGLAVWIVREWKVLRREERNGWTGDDYYGLR